MHTGSPRRRDGFTIIELLVAIGVLTLLIGLLVPALAGVKKRARKADELNRLRQVGVAWAAYANQNDGGLLPGYLGREALAGWGTKFKYPDGTEIPPAPDYAISDPNIAGPWTWRLLPYLDHDPASVLGHRDGASIDVRQLQDRAEEAAFEPAFAYNGMFVGGWWYGPRDFMYERGKDDVTDRRVRLVSRTLGAVRRSAELITFTTAALRTSGTHFQNEVHDDEDGTFLILPPIVQTRAIWGPPRRQSGDLYTIQYYGFEDNDQQQAFVPDG
ncbi:MAG: type II secretion system protein [Planctomycetota bacterium]|jgi:prepilin-type N-terminal cleavage/methylation domain-containing protein